MSNQDNSFYRWIRELNEKEKELEYLISDIDSLGSIGYGERTHKTNKIYSSVERATTDLIELKEQYCKTIITVMAVNEVILNMTYINFLSVKVIQGKIKRVPYGKIKKYSKKAIEDAEITGLEYIKECLKDNKEFKAYYENDF
jgi:hypothetical protein